MIGGMLAGTDKVPGWKEAMARYEETRQYVIENTGGYPYKPERPVISFRGMASKEARGAVGEPETNAEGVSKTVQCKAPGSTEAVIMDVIEGIRSAMSYCGSSTLEEFRKNSSFVRVSSSGLFENHPHFKG
jgi:IMP dehydrogenase